MTDRMRPGTDHKTTSAASPATVQPGMAAEQQALFSDAAPAPPRPPPVPAGHAHAPVWLQRMSLVVLVLFCLYIGVLLVVLPWSQRYWDRNGWLLAHPAVLVVLRQGWARGFVSGLGLLDIWIGISEAIHYHDYRP